MPELPDIVVYIEALEKRIQDTVLKRVRVASPFLLRTAVPPLSSVEGKKVVELRRLGKRICFGFEDELWLVLHLMIAGRLHGHTDPAKAATARGLAAFAGSVCQCRRIRQKLRRRVDSRPSSSVPALWS